MRQAVYGINDMSARQEPAAFPEFTAALCCKRCGETGSVTWQKNQPSPGRTVTAKSPVGISGGFYLRAIVRRKSSSEIVCAKCGAVHQDHG
jgi:hypothetical protein